MFAGKDIDELIEKLSHGDNELIESLLREIDSELQLNDELLNDSKENFMELYPILMELAKVSKDEFIRIDSIRIIDRFNSLFEEHGILEEVSETLIEVLIWDESESVKTSAALSLSLEVYDEFLPEHIAKFIEIYYNSEDINFRHYQHGLLNHCFYIASKEDANNIIKVFRNILSNNLFAQEPYSGFVELKAAVHSLGRIALECDELNRDQIIYDLMELLEKRKDHVYVGDELKDDEIKEIASEALQELAIKLKYYYRMKLITEYKRRKNFLK